MNDLLLQKTDSESYDLVFDGNDLVMGDAVESAIAVSLGSEKRSSDKFSKNLGSHGWWAENTFDGSVFGSEIYKVFSHKIESSTMLLLKQYAEDALKWLVDDGVVDSIDVDVVAESVGAALTVVIVRNGEKSSYRYDFLWSNDGV